MAFAKKMKPEIYFKKAFMGKRKFIFTSFDAQVLTVGSKSGLDKLTVRFLINNKTCANQEMESYKLA